MLKSITVSFLFFICFSAVSAKAQTDFSAWDKRELTSPNGHEMLSPRGENLIRIHIYPVAELEKSARQSLRSQGSGVQEQLEYAMSILSLSMMWNETFDGQTLSGLVQASDGVYSFKSQFSTNQKDFTLALMATNDDGKPLQGRHADARRSNDTATSASYLNTTASVPAPPTRVTKAPARRGQHYAAPETVAQMDAWPSSDRLTKALNPKDPLSPRYYIVQTGPKYGVYDFKTAISKLPSVSNLKLKGKPVVEELEAWKTYDGSTAAIVLQQTNIQNQDGIIVLFMTKKKGQSDIVYFGYEVTEDTYLKWGGITRMMQLRKVIPSIKAFPQSTRDRISRAPFKQQADVYEAALNKVLENGAASMYAMSQAQTLMRMQELNYDLLLGGDITSPMISD